MGLFDKLKDKLAEVQQNNRENQEQRTAPKEVFDRMRDKVQNMEGSSEDWAKRGGLFGVLKDKLEEVRNENRESAAEETAEPDIFDKMKSELEQLESQKDNFEGAAGSEDAWSNVPDSLETKSTRVESSDDMGSIFDKLGGSNIGSGNRSNNKERGDVGEEFNEPTYEEQPSDYGNIERGSTPSTPSPDANAPINLRFPIGSVAQTDSNGGSLAMRIDANMGAGQLTTRIPSNADIKILDFSSQNKINIDGKIAGWVKVDFKGQQGWILDTYLW